jgi:hypothetical protein
MAMTGSGAPRPGASLSTIAESIKSANAGASMLTFDIVLADEQSFDQVREAELVSPAVVARLYGVPADEVAIHYYRPASTVKVTIPRSSYAEQLDESDFDGVQQYIPLLDLVMPDVCQGAQL